MHTLLQHNGNIDVSEPFEELMLNYDPAKLPRNIDNPLISFQVPLTLVISGQITIPSGVVSVPYSGFAVNAFGGSGFDYKFNKIGQWPPGITLDSITGVIGGTPTTPGTFGDLNISASDNHGNFSLLLNSSFEIDVHSLHSVSGYTANAVRFNGSTGLVNNALTTTDAATLSYSYWINITDSHNSYITWIVDPNNYNVYDFNGGQNFSNPNIYSNDFDSLIYASGGSSLFGWTHILVSLDLSQRQICIVINGLVTTTVPQSSAWTPGHLPSYNGKPFYVGDDQFSGDEMIGYMSDFWFDVGTSLLNVNGVIDQSTISKFIDSEGFPVDLGNTGSIPTGSSPTIYLHCGPTDPVSTFLTNRGTGGNFTYSEGTLLATTSTPTTWGS